MAEDYLDRCLTEPQKLVLGLYGTDEINTTAQFDGHWWRITPKEDTVFTALVDSLRSGDAIGAEVFEKSVPITGKFTRITLASGRVIADKYPVLAP